MAYNYDAAKQAWESMNDQQKKQYTEQNKNDANFQQFAQQYHNENYSTGNSNFDVNQWQWTNTPPSNTGGSNFNNDNGSNWGFSDNNWWNNNGWNNNNNNNYWNQWGSPLSDWKNWNWNFYGSTQFDQEEQLDKSMFQQGTWVKVEQGTAKDTGRPDYQLDSDARLAEMTNNLNTYWQTNPEYFSNRETFNKVFEYNQRESDAQRALLDSYWKKKKDMDTASNYNSWDSIYWGLNNAEITPDVFSLIKQMNPEAYQQYQKMLKDEQDKAIANLKFTGAEPLDVTLTNIINKLGIQPWDPHKIRQTFEDRLTELNVWQDSEQLRVLGNNIAGLMSAMNNNAQSLSSQLEGRYSAGYIDARINKANANLQRQANTMLTSYSTLLQWRQQNIALAYQSAQVEQMQANEDQRIFDDKLKSLWFAMEYNSYRTPEQQAALRLEEQQIKNNMELLQKSQENDLALYNKYATAKLENQLEDEFTNLDVSDPAQQRANLNRVVWQYFEKYWDMIQRSQSQVVNDVLAYAKEHWISVGQALSENFIKPLQWKTEYVNMLKSNYADPNDKYKDSYSWTRDANWDIKVTYTWYGDLDLDAIRSTTGDWVWTKRTERNNNPTAMTSDVAKSLWGIEWVDYIVWDEFPNNPNLHTAYLLGDPIDKTIELLDRAATSWRWAFYTASWKQRWTHTAMSDSAWLNLSNEEKKNVVLKMLHNEWWDIDKMAYYHSEWNKSWNLWNITTRDWTTYDTSNAPTYNSLSYDQQNTVKWLLNLSINPSTITKRQYWDDFEKILSAAQELNPNWSTADYWQADKAKKEWNTSSKNGSNSRNATAAATAKEIYDMADKFWNSKFKDWNSLMNLIKKKTSDEEYIKLAVNMQTMASEFAWALKGWTAAPTEKEIDDAKQLLADSFSGWGMKSAAVQIIRQLYNKNVTEADNYRNVTLEKPNPIWIWELPEFMEDVAWLNLSEYYNYKSTAEKYFWDLQVSWTNTNLWDLNNFITFMNN